MLNLLHLRMLNLALGSRLLTRAAVARIRVRRCKEISPYIWPVMDLGFLPG